MALARHFTDKTTTWDKVYILWVILQLPLALLWHGLLILLPFFSNKKTKSWMRTLADRGWQFVLARASVPQLQFAMGMLSTRELYETWSRKRGLPICVEEIEGADARVLWLDGKKTKHVIYYMHGGGYALPLQDFQIAFWRHVQLELKKKHDVDVGVAILHYSLTPNAPFPTILCQAIGGLRLLFDQGIQPQDIHLAGDSAGGNLVLQLFSHILHPLPTVPTISCDSFRGAYLMSPWVSPSNEEGDQAAHDDTDILCSKGLAEFAAFVLCDVPASQRPYVEVLKAPEPWFDGLNKVVNGILISVGDKECLREEGVKLYERLYAKHSDMQMVLQAFGVHIDPLVDAFIGEKMEGAITPRVIEWLAEGFHG